VIFVCAFLVSSVVCDLRAIDNLETSHRICPTAVHNYIVVGSDLRRALTNRCHLTIPSVQVYTYYVTSDIYLHYHVDAYPIPSQDLQI